MAWEEDLFGLLEDLEQQAVAGYAAERAAELADRSRAEYRQVTLVSRLVASQGAEIGLEVRGVGHVVGKLQRVCATWCVVRGAAQDWVVMLRAVCAVRGASDRSTPEVAWSPLTRLEVGSALRRLADARERCVLHLEDGGRHEGVLHRVGADFVEVGDEASRRLTLVSFGALVAVQSRD